MIWSQWVYIAVNIVSLPLYLMIIVVCIKEWKYNHIQRTFYLLIISQGIVDIIVMTSYMCLGTLRVSRLFENFYWSYKDYYIATWCFAQNYVAIFMRCFGVLLLTLQRYITMCRNEWRIEKIINTSHRWILPILQWSLPLLYSLPLLFSSGATFKAPEDLEVVVDKEKITLAATMAAFFVSTTFVLCSLCYGAILKFLISNRFNNHEAMKRERRLYVQMLGLFVGYVLFFIYYIMQFIFSLSSNDGPIYTMRVIYPVISCFFSYVNPWTMFILNDDIREGILSILECRGMIKRNSVHFSTTVKFVSSADVSVC